MEQKRLGASQYVQKKLSQEPPERFWEENYYELMFQLFDNSSSPGEIVAPRLPYDYSGTPEEIEARRTLASQLMRKRADRLDITLSQEWEKQKKVAKATLGADLPADPTLQLITAAASLSPRREILIR